MNPLEFFLVLVLTMPAGNQEEIVIKISSLEDCMEAGLQHVAPSISFYCEPKLATRINRDLEEDNK